MINSADPTLYERPEAFQRVNVHVALDIDFRGVMDALVSEAHPGKRIVNCGFVGVDRRARHEPLYYVSAASFA